MIAVVDASVLVAALVDSGREGEWAESALSEGELAAPELVQVEACNILRLEANGAQGDLLSLAMELFPFLPFAGRVWALRDNLTCYDAWYVAVAEALDCPLLTLDRRLCRASGPRCEFVVPADA